MFERCERALYVSTLYEFLIVVNTSVQQMQLACSANFLFGLNEVTIADC